MVLLSEVDGRSSGQILQIALYTDGTKFAWGKWDCGTSE